MAAPTIRARSARRPLALLAAGACLGLAADGFFHGQQAGLNLPVWIAGLIVWSAWLERGVAETGRGAAGWWQTPALFFAACFAIRDNPFLLALNVLAMLLALSLPFLSAAGVAPWRAYIIDYAAGLIAAGLHTVFGALALVFGDVNWQAHGGVSGRRAGVALAGTAIAGAVGLFFTLIFASADPLLQRVLRSVFELNAGPLIGHVVFALFMGALATGYLRGRIATPRDQAPYSARLPRLPVDPLIVLMATGAMAGAFTLFVALQARYLFGGAAFVQQATGLTLAEYARGGFFQCVAACAFALPLLLAGDWLVGAADPRALKSFRALALLQTGLVAAVGASALSRMGLYAASFGLSNDRIFAIALLVWLVGVTGWFAVTVLRGARQRFAWGAVAGGFVTLGALNAVNPDALIARYNVAHVAPGRALDVKYLTQLSADAAPALVQGLAAMRDDEACYVLAALKAKRWVQPGDWRSANLARFHARRAVGAAPACET